MFHFVYPPPQEEEFGFFSKKPIKFGPFGHFFFKDADKINQPHGFHFSKGADKNLMVRIPAISREVAGVRIKNGTSRDAVVAPYQGNSENTICKLLTVSC